jgi:alcohol dehydrogenase (NADP+)
LIESHGLWCDSYGTEKAVGRGVKKSGIPRKDLFITTKLWNNSHHPDDVAPALQNSLNDLGMDYVDLYLIHWPVAWKRGEEMFPKQNGNPVLENIDLMDVSCVLIPCQIPRWRD